MNSDLSGYLVAYQTYRPDDIPRFTRGEWDGKKCPLCDNETLTDKINGDRWCGNVWADISWPWPRGNAKFHFTDAA